MLTVEKKEKYTAADYMLLEEGAPFQLINHELVMSPSPVPLHQQIAFELSEIIVLYHIKNGRKGQWLFAPMDVHFDEGNVLQPDIFFIDEDRKATVITDRIKGAPDLIIEILSSSNASYDLKQKRDIYEKYGVKEYIIVDPLAHDLQLYVLNDGVYYLHQKVQQNEVLNSALLPGFSIEAGRIFR